MIRPLLPLTVGLLIGGYLGALGWASEDWPPLVAVLVTAALTAVVATVAAFLRACASESDGVPVQASRHQDSTARPPDAATAPPEPHPANPAHRRNEDT